MTTEPPLPPSPSAALLAHARVLWSLDHDIEFIRFSESHVYGGTRNKRGLILRFMPSAHRPLDHVKAELDWIMFLTARGLEVAEPQRSSEQRLIEELEDESGKYWVSVFRRARGHELSTEEMGQDFCRNLGGFLGRCHKLTSRYSPAPGSPRRPQWDEDESFRLANIGLNREDRIEHEVFIETTKWLRTLPKAASSFGLIHADLHARNLFIDDGRITAFDFDDSCYHWYDHDLTAPMVSIARADGKTEITTEEERRVDSLLHGYAEEGLADISRDRLHKFFAFRLSLVFFWMKARMKDGSMNEERRRHCRELIPWFQARLAAAHKEL